MRLEDFVEINPRVPLQNGGEYRFVEMGAITPGRRYVEAARSRAYKGGGARFRPGDTLFARITPCLENGKIAQFVGPAGEPGFGSTEFFVLRGKPGLSHAGYVFYLACTHLVRKPAEKSMSGASGRQRADLGAVKDIQVAAPPMPVQRKIAAILSAYDDLIENNLRRIKILEEMAQLIYREWFVEFRFPGHQKMRMVDSSAGKIPEGWRLTKLGEVIELAYGKGLKASDRVEGEIPVYGSSGIIGQHNAELVQGPGVIVGRKGNVGSVHWSHSGFFPIDTVFYVRTDLPLHYVYYNVQTQNFLNTDAAVPGLKRSQAYLLPFLVPDSLLLKRFSMVIAPIFLMQKNLRDRCETLRNMRDLLLPRLISGQLSVEGIELQS